MSIISKRHISRKELTMAYNKVVISGINTTELTVLKEHEKIELLKEIQKTGSKAARDKLINGNLRLVLSVIQKFAGRGEDIDDLFQIGVVGLIKAINNFDLTKEVRFSTYCVPMISGELRRHLRDYSQIKVSRSLRDLAYKASGRRDSTRKYYRASFTIRACIFRIRRHIIYNGPDKR